MGLLQFFKYNNIVPIAISMVLLGAGGAYAATDPDAIFASEEEVVTVDNTYIATKDLSSYTPTIRITAVTEDEENYYVAYAFTTIRLEGHVWRDLTKGESMQVAKGSLDGKDLGLHVSIQLKNIVSNELAFLRQVQEKERAIITQKTVITSYSGLVGTFINSSTEVLPPYEPEPTPVAVVTPPSQVAAPAAAGGNSTPTSPAPTSASVSTSVTLSIQILGNNPAQVAKGSGYVDLGAVLIDLQGGNLGLHTFLDGVEVTSLSIDTSINRTYSIEYRATDLGGGVASALRTVIVGSGTPPPEPATPEENSSNAEGTEETIPASAEETPVQ